MQKLIRVTKKSKGAEKRLYKAVRLMILYLHKANNHCWRQKTKDRYMEAYHSMRSWVIRMCRNIAGEFRWWRCDAIGSRQAVDLEADRGLGFLLVLSDNEDLS